VLLGDRLNLKSLAIVSSEVVAEMIAPGSGEPGLLRQLECALKVFALQDRVISPGTAADELSQMSLAESQWHAVAA